MQGTLITACLGRSAPNRVECIYRILILMPPWQRIQPSAHADILLLHSITYLYLHTSSNGRKGKMVKKKKKKWRSCKRRRHALGLPILHEIRLLNASKKQRQQTVSVCRVGRRCEIKIKPPQRPARQPDMEGREEREEQEFAPSSRNKKKKKKRDPLSETTDKISPNERQTAGSVISRPEAASSSLSSFLQDERRG